MSVTTEQVEQVLTALAEEFLVDVPAYFDEKGTYLIDYNELVSFFLGVGANGSQHREYTEDIAQYIALKEFT